MTTRVRRPSLGETTRDHQKRIRRLEALPAPEPVDPCGCTEGDCVDPLELGGPLAYWQFEEYSPDGEWHPRWDYPAGTYGDGIPGSSAGDYQDNLVFDLSGNAHNLRASIVFYESYFALAGPKADSYYPSLVPSPTGLGVQFNHDYWDGTDATGTDLPDFTHLQAQGGIDTEYEHDEWTVLAWVKFLGDSPSLIPAYQMPVIDVRRQWLTTGPHGPSDYQGGWQLLMNSKTGQVTYVSAGNQAAPLSVVDPDEVNWSYTTPGGLVVPGRWHHIATTITDAGGGSWRRRFYLDGVKLTDQTGASIGPGYIGDNPVLGFSFSHHDPPGYGTGETILRSFRGGIDGVSIWDVALDDDQVASLALCSDPVGSTYSPVRTVVVDYDVAVSDEVILGDGTLTVTLFSAAAQAGHRVTVKNIAGGVVTLDSGADSLDGAPGGTYALATTHQAVEVISDGDGWRIVGAYL